MRFEGLKAVRVDNVTFVALPAEAGRPITGGCDCPFCASHPDKTPMWDTLAAPDSGTTWVVHFPEVGA